MLQLCLYPTRTSALVVRDLEDGARHSDKLEYEYITALIKSRTRDMRLSYVVLACRNFPSHDSQNLRALMAYV